MHTYSDHRLQALAAFADSAKFCCTETEFQHLNPSPAADAQPAALKQCIAASLYALAKPLDTEDREYLAYYYHQLGLCVGVNVAPLLNRWLYGWLLATLLRFSGRR